MLPGTVGRTECCQQCGCELRCCANCAFFELSSANQCQEPNADPVLEKDRGNFCEYFSFLDLPKKDNRGREPREDPRQGLERLFKKKI